jgi:hypothetical protein
MPLSVSSLFLCISKRMFCNICTTLYIYIYIYIERERERESVLNNSIN